MTLSAPLTPLERYRRSRPWPLARLGYAYATALGFTWGALLSTGRITRHDGLWVFRGMPRWSFGRGGSCVGSCYLTDRNDGPAVLRHERVHRAQWRHYGMAMPLLYLFAGRDPLRNRFEIEAGLEDGGYVRRARRPRPHRAESQQAAPQPSAPQPTAPQPTAHSAVTHPVS